MYQVASLRSSISSFQEQASCKAKVSKVFVPYKLCQPFNLQMSLSSPLKVNCCARPMVWKPTYVHVMTDPHTFSCLKSSAELNHYTQAPSPFLIDRFCYIPSHKKLLLRSSKCFFFLCVLIC